MPRLLTAAMPFVLGLAYKRRDFTAVQTHWNKYFTRKVGKDSTSWAIMCRVLQQIRQDGYVLRERYRFPLADVLNATNGAWEEEAGGALRELLAFTFVFEEPNQAGFQLLSLLDTTKEHPVGQDSEAVALVLNPQLRNYLLNVARLRELPLTAAR